MSDGMTVIGRTPHCDTHRQHTYGCRPCSDALIDGYRRTLDVVIALRQQARGAVANERTRWVRLILQADELQDPAGALAALVNMARVEHDRPAGGQ